ncbi:helix-turn-helix domain-containing protein [Bradyrhizobium lablabi]|uniref:helix-turn-helix domain-containing protein n=1 Tax=Bradyrhizobium lablabi TaxID=722472 RepID=UPI001BA45873|nr:helix-turn-helix domain-containing protein [Bradyrhizobium lablabi]MBR1126087.1 helix-turn-helix domain-containing protein [Bradyrhizobium lablabi]
MILFSTDDIAPRDRFDHWREERSRALFGVTIEIEPERRAGFQGHFSAVAVGCAKLAEMKASSYVVSRTSADIARIAADSLSIGHQIRGPGWMDAGEDRVSLLEEGRFAVSYSDLPYKGTPKRTDGFHFRSLSVPLAAFPDLAKPARQLWGQPAAASPQLENLFSATFGAMAAEGETWPDAQRVVRHVAQLALLLRGVVPAGTGRSRAAVRFGQFHAARRLISANLHRPDLSPQMIADWLAISLRQLHLLFEPTGESCARTILSMRLREARRRLMTRKGEPVAQIAFACGFASIATFYRTFQTAYGIAPGDARVAAAE